MSKPNSHMYKATITITRQPTTTHHPARSLSNYLPRRSSIIVGAPTHDRRPSSRRPINKSTWHAYNLIKSFQGTQWIPNNNMCRAANPWRYGACVIVLQADYVPMVRSSRRWCLVAQLHALNKPTRSRWRPTHTSYNYKEFDLRTRGRSCRVNIQ